MIEIRPMAPDEADQVGELTVRAYVASGALGADAPYLVELRDTAGRGADSPVYVAVCEGEIAGTVTWCPPGSRHQEVAAAGEAEFRMLAVAPEFMGRGVGRALVAHVLDLGREAHLDAVVLSSATSMRAAHHLYPAMGFVRLPQRDWTPVPGIDCLAYGHDLSPRTS